MADTFSHNIVEQYGVLSTAKSGWNTEFNLVAWGNYEPKYDIRPWSPTHDKMGKGITLTREELSELRNILNKMDL